MNPRHSNAPADDGGEAKDRVGTGSVSILAPGSDIAERHFIGALLHMPASTVAAAGQVVFPEWVHDPQVRGVYVALLDNVANGLQPDPAGVVPTMLRLGLPVHRAGSASSLVVDLLAEVPIPGNWRYYAVIVASSHVRHQLHEVGRLLTEGAHSEPLDRLHGLLEDARLDLEATNGHLLQLATVGGVP